MHITFQAESLDDRAFRALLVDQVLPVLEAGIVVSIMDTVLQLTERHWKDGVAATADGSA